METYGNLSKPSLSTYRFPFVGFLGGAFEVPLVAISLVKTELWAFMGTVLPREDHNCHKLQSFSEVFLGRETCAGAHTCLKGKERSKQHMFPGRLTPFP